MAATTTTSWSAEHSTSAPEILPEPPLQVVIIKGTVEKLVGECATGLELRDTIDTHRP